MGQSDSGGESLEARFYDHLRASGTTTDHNEYSGVPSLAYEMEVSPDELQPIIERGVADKRLAGKWQAGVKLYSLATPRYLAERAQAAERADEVIGELTGDEPEPKNPGKPATRKPAKAKQPRLTWRYAPVPLAIVNDRGLSNGAVRVAAIIAGRINLGKWNTDLHVDISAADLASSRWTAMRAIAELRDAGHLRTESRGRGGIRFWFTDSANL